MAEDQGITTPPPNEFDGKALGSSPKLGELENAKRKAARKMERPFWLTRGPG